ncbi:hypothetical protein EVAR_55906_1 [Eumeta japonica]|uniref:Uncharacterized protein n=1 Tax=Eumeta variegata TaxID=151549 RepID=A0A4C1YMY4_EUMVA|nr:hypothetical protein EVAR_55906_1 [Eumeta japonica]
MIGIEIGNSTEIKFGNKTAIESGNGIGVHLIKTGLCAAAVSLLLGRIGRWSGRELSISRVTSRTFRPIVPLYRLFRALASTFGSGGT